MIRKYYLDKSGNYRSLFRASEDYDLWLRLIEHSKFSCISFPLYKLRIHSESISGRLNYLQRADREIHLTFAIERKVKGVDELGLKYKDKWVESDEKNKWTYHLKARSFKNYSKAYVYYARGKKIRCISNLMVSLLLHPKNPVTRKFICKLIQRKRNRTR